MNYPDKSTHPGQVVFNNLTDGIKKVTAARELPESFLFKKTEESGWIPVVKVEAHIRGNKMIIHQYGPNNELLRSTFGFAGEKDA
jgi:hypothetical protein